MKNIAIFITIIISLYCTSALSTLIHIADISDELIGEIVTIKGEVLDKAVFNNGNVSIEINDSTGSIQTLIFESLSINHEQYQTGSHIEVTGKIKNYKGTLEIQPRSDVDIKTYGMNKIFTADDVGREVEILAVVLSEYKHPKGHLFLTVSVDGTDQELEVPIFNNSPIGGENISTGATIRVQGKVSVYMDKLQIVPESVLLLGESEVDTPKLIPVGEITREQRGKTYQVMVLMESISHGGGNAFLVLVDINTEDKIKAVLFRADAEEIVGRKVKLVESHKNGIPVRLLVSVNIYNGELQLIIDKVFNDLWST